MLDQNEIFEQLRIPGGLSPVRYISGFYALNLPAPEGTSGDWHFFGTFYRKSGKSGDVLLAGEGEQINTNAILSDYGIYRCDKALERRGLIAEKPAYAANHFRAILDLLYEQIKEKRTPSNLFGASEDFLDTEDEKRLLIEKASHMLLSLESDEQMLMLQWINHERKTGYRG